MDYALLKDEQLVALCKENDDKAFDFLTERYIPVSKFHASHFYTPAIENEDLTQEGLLGFIAAVYAYNEKSGNTFSTFAGHCIKNRIVDAIRTISSKKHIPVELTVPLEKQSSLSTGLTPEEVLVSQSEAERLSALIETRLSEKEQKVFRLFLQGMRYEQIAAECSCTAKSVDGTMQRVRKKLREQLS